MQEVQQAKPVAPFRIVSRIYEDDLPFPVVEHIFNGQTLRQASAFYAAHLKSDAFLSGCVHGTFRKTRCREEHYAMRWTGNGWGKI